MNKVKWGIIGCGDVTEVKSGPAFNKVQHSELFAVMRRDASKAAEYAARHKVQRWYSDADALINDPDINAIYVATPPQMHAEFAIKAMQAGKPVYVEKPMATRYSECLHMNKIAEQTNIPLFVAYYRRSLPYFMQIKNMLLAQSIGQILFVNVNLWLTARKDDLDSQNLPWRVQPQISGGGYFYDMACHQSDLLDFFFGPITEVTGVYANRAKLYNAEDVVSASMKFESGIVASGLWCFTTYPSAKKDTIEIVGTKGKITFSTFEFSPILLENANGKEEFKPANPENIQFCMIQDVVNELRGIGKSPSNGISGARTNHVMDIILDKVRHAQETCSRT